MSTPEQGGGNLPGEAQLLIGQAPKHTDTPSQGFPTPGVSSSAVRHPGVPTLPSPETSFSAVLQRLANDLFKPVPPAGAMDVSPAPVGPSVAVAQGLPQTPQAHAPGLSPGATSTGYSASSPPTQAPQGLPREGMPPAPASLAGERDAVTGVPEAPSPVVPAAPNVGGGIPGAAAFPMPGAPAFAPPEAGAQPVSPSSHRYVPNDNPGYNQASAPQPRDASPGHVVQRHAPPDADRNFEPHHAQRSYDAGGRGFEAADVQKTAAATDAPATHGAASSLAPRREGESPFGASHREGASPFHAPLRFDALGANPLPAIDGGMHSPVDQQAPYWLQPARSGETTPSQHRGIFDAHAIRREFPILHQRVNGHRLVWLDNAATTQKPQAVIDRLKHFYEHDNSNIHRAAHTLAARSTDAYEQARETVRRFINAPSKNEIVFVRGTTEGINLVAQSWGRRNIEEGDEIVISHLEHHANIVPWHRLCSEKKATLRVAPVDDRGQVLLEEYEKLLGPKTKLVAFSQVSNALGTITPARDMIELAHRHGAKVLLDGAQAVSHLRVDVQQLDCDFYVFSGHKVFAPTGIGVVFGKAPILEAMPPWQGGGNMIQDVTFEKVVYQGPPAKFEAGTGNIADAVGLGAALDWLMRIGVDNVGRWEHELLEYATPRLLAVPGLKLLGTAPDKAGVLSFTLAGQKTEEVGGLLDKEGIAVRSGHHCAQPILRRMGVESSVRASLAPYNTFEDLDALCEALHRLQVGKPTRHSAARPS